MRLRRSAISENIYLTLIEEFIIFIIVNKTAVATQISVIIVNSGGLRNLAPNGSVSDVNASDPLWYLSVARGHHDLMTLHYTFASIVETNSLFRH